MVAQSIDSFDGIISDEIKKGRPRDMDKDRIAGAAKQAKGTIKEATGKVFGDSKLVADGQSDKAEGKVQNAVGGVKDAVKDAWKK
jgi:uncharacterized protein YjbJ (UPF0337 family)